MFVVESSPYNHNNYVVFNMEYEWQQRISWNINYILEQSISESFDIIYYIIMFVSWQSFMKTSY